jgi:CubicO group peptidase (beta-lactamase class C family)
MNIRVRTTFSGFAPASARAATMISRQRRACSYASSGGGAPSGMTGAVPATCTWGPVTTAREKPATGSYGEPEEMRRRRIRLVSRRVEALRQVEGWGASVAVGVLRDGEVVGSLGSRDAEFRWASVTKPVVALAALVAAEEGSIDLDEAAGPEGSTVRHLLAHASGLPFEGPTPIAKVGTRRIYSNTGFELLADALARAAEMPFEHYLRAAVFEPLGLRAELRGTAAAGIHGTLDDALAVARELQSPTLVAPETLAEATSVQFPGLGGVLPDVGRFAPNEWGLGVELRDGKQPHWTGTRNSERTFGHFGGSGTFLWVDPEAGVACACLSDREFGPWALEAWPPLSDAVLAEV